ncbi:MAG TPA: apolipoprotein N-acyltransferase [Geobacteraceae bacterium]|jgi:apolipoprotein N-acyltransferase|nr:apolipoprotein N-acyltransferase [Geobacteraceae bacterium]
MSEHAAVTRRDYILAALSGVLLALSFPRPALSFLAWFAFVPLLLAISRKSPRTAFRVGFVCGLVAYGGILYWLNIVMTTYGKLHWSVSFTLFLFLVAYLALYPAVVVFVTRRGEEAGISPLLSFPTVWVGLEFIRAYFLTGFPWASLGYSQYRTLPLIQIADITGVYGLSFLIAFANVVIFRVIRGMVRKEGAAYPTVSVVLLLLSLVVTLGYGFHRLRAPERGEPLKVGLTQGNIPQDVKWDPAFQEQTVAVYEKLSREACADGCDLLVWPESAAPFYFQNDVHYAARIRALVAGLKNCAVIGSPAIEYDRGAIRYLNSAFLLGPDGEVLGRSDKMHLVPFGEYVPLAKLLPFVTKMVAGIGDFSPAAAITPLDTGKGKIGVLICFEGIFPELSRAYVRAGSRLLVNITNDAWFGRSSAPYQHLSMSVFRAVENRVPLVRSANTGITAIIDSRGHIRRMTPIFTETTLSGEVRLGSGGSFYTRFGDLFALACLVVTVVVAVSSLKFRVSS